LRSLLLALVSWALGIEVAMIGAGVRARIWGRYHSADACFNAIDAEWHKHCAARIGECIRVVADATMRLVVGGYHNHY
jgi:hypothetical protein